MWWYIAIKRGTCLVRVENEVIRETPPLFRHLVGRTLGPVVSQWIRRGELLTLAQVGDNPPQLQETPTSSLRDKV